MSASTGSASSAELKKNVKAAAFVRHFNAAATQVDGSAASLKQFSHVTASLLPSFQLTKEELLPLLKQQQQRFASLAASLADQIDALNPPKAAASPPPAVRVVFPPPAEAAAATPSQPAPIKFVFSATAAASSHAATPQQQPNAASTAASQALPEQLNFGAKAGSSMLPHEMGSLILLPSKTFVPVTTAPIAPVKESPLFHKVTLEPCTSKPFSSEEKGALTGLFRCLLQRVKYMRLPTPIAAEIAVQVDHPDTSFRMRDGVMRVLNGDKDLFAVHSADVFFEDLQQLNAFVLAGQPNTLARKRLQILKHKFSLHEVCNWDLEDEATHGDSRDFFNIAKVDNHIHLAAAMTSVHLLTFIRDKLHSSPNDVVAFEKGRNVTLAEKFQSVGLSEDSLSVDMLDTGGGRRMFQRFDYFNASYSPFGLNDFRTIFLKTENFQKGRYFAELVKEVYANTESMRHNVLLEPRLSIYGKAKKEWSELADWVIDFKVTSNSVLYLIQLPRIYPVVKTVMKAVQSFGQMLDNIFAPLFESTLHPELNPKLAQLLELVVAFDSVDDESIVDDLLPPHQADGSLPAPEQWTSDKNPNYSYYCYYIWANLHILNQLREARGLNTFTFRPHCGEAGRVHHLSSAFLLAHSINHGIRLEKSPSLTYLYYLAQIGMSISPLSNNTLFLPLADSPFRTFFRYGLNVTLSTDDPLQFHSTAEPLVEEYTMMKQNAKLSSTDLSELARNSVLQSGFSHARKCQMLGDRYFLPGIEGNDVDKSNIPDLRVEYRSQTLQHEIDLVCAAAQGSADIELDFFKTLRAEQADSWHARVFDVLQHTSPLTPGGASAVDPSMRRLLSKSAAPSNEHAGGSHLDEDE